MTGNRSVGNPTGRGARRISNSLTGVAGSTGVTKHRLCWARTTASFEALHKPANTWKSFMTDTTDRIDELESRLAYIENMQEELSAVIADHGKTIDQLRKLAQRQNEKLSELADDRLQKPPENVPPPHY